LKKQHNNYICVVKYYSFFISGIVNCATIANGIVGACKQNPPKHPLVIRLEGTNADAARKILEGSGLPVTIMNDADEAAKTAVKLARQ
jgi:succinyl-CoA synthetase beta subunit